MSGFYYGIYYSFEVGIIHQEAWVRDGYNDKQESSRKRRDRSRESECWQRGIESVDKRCIGKRIISIFDRGGDIYEVLALHEQKRQGYIIRAGQNRLLCDGQTHLFEDIRQSEEIGKIEINVPAKNGRKGRKALLSIHQKTLKIKPPKNLDRKGAELIVNVVEAYEHHAPKGCECLRWVLLTNEPTNTFEESVEVVMLYTRRWKIEEFHKSLKTGCGLEKRQFKSRKTLETFLGLASIISIELLNLRDNAKNVVCTEHGLSNIQIYILRKQYPHLGKKPRSMDVLRAIAQMGGFMGRKSDGNPGWLTLWRGMQELMLMEQGFILANFKTPFTSILPKLVGTV